MKTFIKQKNNQVYSELNITNLVDVMLVLLIVFIIVAPMIEQGIDVRLPVASDKKMETKTVPVIVSVSKEGELFLNNVKVSLDKLENRLAVMVNNNPDLPVILRADKKLTYESVIKIMDRIRNAGVNNVGMATGSENYN
ncbi:MAG: biopolymer transporter ExbD [Candidatus Aureabacteria bacterium]|nr:biopolymer transporter ExbD [Candidatus Auribacterota bacterium]